MNAIIFTGYEHSGALERVNGAYRIATLLRKEGWNVEVIDYFYFWTYEQLTELIQNRNQRYKIDWIGFSTTWLNYSKEPTQLTMLRFLTFIKKNYPSVVTIAGGQNPSLHFPMYEKIDYVIGGFGENAIFEVLKFIYGNSTNLKRWPRKGGGYYIDANSHYQAWPMKDMAVDYEERDFINQGETLAIEISRGCKFACAFCNFPILGIKEDTTRDLEQLEFEFKRNYERWGVTNYQIADETLNDRDEKLAKIGRIAKGLDFQLNLNAFIRGDILFSRPQQLELLNEAGVWGHYYGIETFNHETGKVVGKGMHPDKIKQGLLDTKNYFYKNNNGRYRGTISLIYGLPKETKESILEGLNWACENWNDQNMIAFPYNINLTGKKSKIDEDLEKYGYKILSEEKRNLYNRHNFFANDLAIWENDNMNVYDAIDLVNLQLEKFTPGFLDCWKLWSMLSVTENVDVALTLNEKNNKEMDPYYAKASAAKENYVNKKLGL